MNFDKKYWYLLIMACELSKRTGMISLFGRAIYYDDGEYGDAILSKTTIINLRNVALPHQQGYEPRTAIEILAVIGTNDTIAFIATHLDDVKDDTNRLMQAKKINSAFSENKYPTILAGDLNDNPSSKTINILESVWPPTYNTSSYDHTFPSDKPTKKIDYIMYKPHNSITVITTEVVRDTIASDHCAYLATLKLNK